MASTINLSDYNHAGIYVEERNSSVIDTPAPQEAIVNFVPGFSRKGTVFNRPVLVKTKDDRFKYFGDIDRYLEKKGSFFHRTIDVCLQTSPIWAMNILKTNSLDQLNYKSVSLAAQYDNLPVLQNQYDTFFNKAGFWQRDTESFLFFARNTQQMIHFTNLGDQKSTIFMFKSPAAGFNLTAEVWYGGADKVPTWMSRYDLISDYIVRVVIVRGDYSNYVTLAADPYWAKYFSSSGIRKTMVDAFTRDRAVTTLGVYDGALIPYFRDANNNNIFIESLINLDTDKTGIFCAFDTDNVETDFPSGRVDIIGQTLVDLNKSKIDFMSYQDTIEEIDTYSNKALDSLGNVIGIGTTSGRTTVNTNGRISTSVSSTAGLATSTPSISITAGTANINNTLQTITGATYTSTIIPTPALGYNYRIDTLYLDQNGVIAYAYGTVFNSAVDYDPTIIGQEALAVTAGLTYPASMPNNAIVLGYLYRQVSNAPVYKAVYVPVALSGTGYVPLTIGTGPTDDLQVATTANNILDVTFYQTATATKANYKAWRRVLFFNEIVTKKLLANSVAIDSTGAKVDLSTALWSDNYTSGTGDKNFVLTVASANIRTAPAAGNFTFYYTDNEFIVTTPAPLVGLETRNTITGTTGYGIAAKLSSFYQDFLNGRINTGDFFYVKLLNSTSLKFVHYTNLSNPASVGDWIIMTSAEATLLGLGVGSNNLHIYIQSHPVNTGDFLITNGYDYDAVPVAGTPEYGLQGDGYLASGEIAFQVNNLVSTYTSTMNLPIYDYNQKLYLKMYFLGATLKTEFMADSVLQTPGSVPAALVAINDTLNIFSGEASYTQTLEIETHNAYTMTDTKFLIDLNRYPEVKVGNYVKAYIDTNNLQVGEYPKKFARIIKKQPWSGNTTYNVNYAEITVDVKVDIQAYGPSNSDLQTTRYTTIEDYVDTYKAISLTGFNTQSTAWPDGTEAKQSAILDVIGKETSLYYAIVNKNKFNFRYLVDSFGLGLTEFSKQQLADLTGKRKNCIGFLNMPSAKYFKSSSSPSFINEDGTLNTGYVKDGGNLEANPPFLYSFAQGSGKDDGRDTVGYFFPYVTVNDNGRPLLFPPASYVMNTYQRKLNSTVTGIYPWTVAAGIENGRILGISNVEMDFTEKDLENFYAMGANPLMYAKNVGFYIETEWTASRNPLSSLSFLHSREVLIDLENELYAMLLKYQWKFNTSAIRAKIKREADEICQRYVDRSALYAYENIIDESNNTPTLIDNQFGLLETKIEIVKAMGVIVNIINVMATGALGSSTGFTA